MAKRKRPEQRNDQERRFGAFWRLFDSDAHYLSLLGLERPEADIAVAKVLEGNRTSSDLQRDIGELLDEMNWRPHLVAAVAISAIDYQPRILAKLWDAFDAGSWVTPQLAVAAYLRDPDFSRQAAMRVSGVFESSLSNPLSAKAVNALIALLNLKGCSSMIKTELDDEGFVSWRASDPDDGSGLAEDWLSSLQGIFRTLASRGTTARRSISRLERS